MSEETRPSAQADRAGDTAEADEATDLTEVAGETTAAGTVSGPADTRPVGAGTEVEVEDARGRGPSAKGSE